MLRVLTRKVPLFVSCSVISVAVLLFPGGCCQLDGDTCFPATSFYLCSLKAQTIKSDHPGVFMKKENVSEIK